MKRAIVLILAVALLAAALTGCGWSIRLGNATISGPGKLFDVNDHGEQDLAGVTSIEISSVSDTITLTPGGDKVTADLKGQCRSATDPVWLDMRKDGSTIVVEVKYPNVSISCNTSLAVSIPEGYGGSLSVKTVSGSIEAENLPYELQKVSLGTVSGGINFDAKSMTGLKADAVSGNVSVTGIAGDATANSISGGIDLDFNTVAAVTAGTVSGSVNVKIPKDSSCQVEFHSISGSFHSDITGLDISSSGHSFTETAGNGGPLVKVNTTSGDFKLEGK